MTGSQRRNQILTTLKDADGPIAGYKFAKELGVSRQVIVQDIALLRAEKHDIMATSRGYLLYSNNNNLKQRLIRSTHGHDNLEQELRIIVDYGGRILDVLIEHDVYGEIRADLMIESDEDINLFISKMTGDELIPMISSLTNGIHYHTIEAKNDKILDVIEQEVSKLK